jgi:HEAT repeat protein
MRRTLPGASAVALALITVQTAVAQDATRTEKWAASLTKRDALEQFLAAWNLIALGPGSADAIVARVGQGRLGNDSLVAASEALGEIGSPKAIDALLPVVRDPRQPSDARVAALVALAKIGGKEGVAALTAIASEDAGQDAVSEILRCAALIALGMRGDEIAPATIESALASPDAELRRAALRTIGFLKDRRFIPHCTKALGDENTLVVTQAALSLGKINDPKSGDAIVALRKKVSNPGMRFLLDEALAWMGNKEAIDELLSFLEDPASRLQESSATVLVELGEKRAIPGLRAALEAALDRKTVEPGTDVRAAYGLGVLQDQGAGPLLVRALAKGTVEVQREAAAALGALRWKDGAAALRDATRAKDRQLRTLALIALGELGDPSSGDDIAAALDDRDPVIRYAGCVGLGLFGNRKAIPLLQGMTQDEHDFVIAAAAEAVSRLEERPLAAADPRDPAVLSRLRSLEREYVFRAQVGRLYDSFQVLNAQISARTGPADVYVLVGAIVDT